MKCTHCGSQWNSNTAVTVCPFCHKPLNTALNGPKTLTSTLVQIRDQFGVETLGKGKVLLSSFKDIAPELKREGVMLSHLDKYDGFKTLYEAKDKSNIEQQTAVSKVVCSLTDNFVDKSAAENICMIYMLVLTGKENEVQKPNSEKDLADFRQKLTERLREQVPAQAATASKTPAPAVLEFQIDANGKLLKYNGNTSIVRVPDYVKIIGAKAFHRNPLITHIILPEGLISIEEEAFAVCPSLQNVSFPATLQSIGDKAFWACNALREVTLPGSVKTITPLAFWACKGMTKVTLQEGITDLGADAFNYCGALKDIYLPKSLKTVHPRAFTGAMDARVSGNSAWTVKDGHVVANTAADTTYRNAGTNQKMVIAPAANQSRNEQPKATNPRAYQNEQLPKPPVTPPKPPVTPPQSPVTPKAAPAAKPATKTPFLMRLLGSLMYPAWGAAIYFFFEGIEPINTDGSFYLFFLAMAGLFILSRVLFKKSRVFWGLFLSFCAAGNLIQFYEFSPDSTVNNIIMIAYPILCAITSFCHGPIFDRFKK